MIGKTPPWLTFVHKSHALKFGNQKINLHLSGHEFEPKASKVQPGSGDLCFITQHPIDDVLASWKGDGIEVSLARSCVVGCMSLLTLMAFLQVLEGSKVVDRTGAVGKLRSVYCRDPDGNLIEYGPHHTLGICECPADIAFV